MAAVQKWDRPSHLRTAARIMSYALGAHGAEARHAIPALLVSYVAAAEAPAAAVPPEAAEMAQLLGIGAVLTLYAALAPGRGTPPLRTRSNLLAPFSDREQADDLERRFRSPGQRRQPLQRVLAGGELGDRRHLHLLRRQHPRADQHRTDHGR